MGKNRRSNQIKRYIKSNIVKILKKKPTTSSKRNFQFLYKLDVLKTISFLKLKTVGLKKNLGRSFGKIVSRFRSKGRKLKYKKIEEYRYPLIHEGILEQIEYYTMNSMVLARIFNPYLNLHFYIRYPEGLKTGFFIKSRPQENYKLGDAVLLKNFCKHKPIHNINKFNKNNISRCSGTFCIIIQKYKNFCLLKVPSKKYIYIDSLSQGTLGRLPNRGFKLQFLGKAGRNRWLGKRPHVRGVAMNPIDHPHGGGEGKTSGGVQTSVSIWGKPTKQIKKKKINKNFFIKIKKQINEENRKKKR